MEISDILHLRTKINKTKEDKNRFLIHLSKKVKDVREQELAKLPFQANVISACAHGNLYETAHSRILGNLLQDKSICKNFVEFFLPECKTDVFEVAVEESRIDVSLKGKVNFIIIENKINNAQEQDGQLCRYAQKAIENYSAKNIYILYLNSDHHEKPSDYSTNYENHNLYEYIAKEHLKVLSYKEDILQRWLPKIQAEIPEKESLLKSALCQYIDYLENKFETSKRFDNMNMEIRKELIESLSLNNEVNDVERCKHCKEVIVDLQELINNVREIQKSYAETLANSWETKLKEIFAGCNVKKALWEESNQYNYHIEVKYNGQSIDFVIGIYKWEENWLSWWGITGVGTHYKSLAKRVEQYTNEGNKDSGDWCGGWKSMSIDDDILAEVKKVKELLEK